MSSGVSATCGRVKMSSAADWYLSPPSPYVLVPVRTIFLALIVLPKSISFGLLLFGQSVTVKVCSLPDSSVTASFTSRKFPFESDARGT